MSEIDDMAEAAFAEWFATQEFGRDVSKSVVRSSFLAGWMLRSMLEDRVDPEKVNRLRRVLRQKIAESDKWLPLLGGCSMDNIIAAGPIRVDRWNLDECRQVWEWIQNDIPPPQCLLDEVKRIREAE